jgi:glycosyltransferase involved in cell wall biosynthesis
LNKSLYYIKHGSIHHAKHSGYTRLLEYMPGETIEGVYSKIPYRLRKIIASSITNTKGIYDSSSVQKDLALINQMLKNNDGIAHFLNGERDLRFSTYLKPLRNWKFTASFHEPPATIIKEIQNFKYINRLDGAIAVGINQLQLLKDKIGGDAISYIPHGVDTNYFSPVSEEWEKYTCIMVGQHLRDFDVLEKVVFELKRKLPKFKLKVIIREDFVNLLPKSENIEIYNNVSDEKLKELYRSASFLLLPLKEVTACNAILEALACGIPVITSDLEGNRGYLDESCSFMVKNNHIKKMFECATLLFEDDLLNRQMRINARKQSMKFSWEQIATEIITYYKKYFGY